MAMLCHKCKNNVEPDIMTGMRILVTGIAQARDQIFIAHCWLAKYNPDPDDTAIRNSASVAQSRICDERNKGKKNPPLKAGIDKLF
jgi:hypothetical protein